MVEVFAGGGAGEMYTLMLPNSYKYMAIDHVWNPMLTGVTPHAASSEEPVTLTGSNLGFWIQDYQMVYVGTGRPPQGGNIVTPHSDPQLEATHVQCTPEDLNGAKNPSDSNLKTAPTGPVMKEDRNADPIKDNTFTCALNPFMAGSYNVSLYMGNSKRAGGGNSDSYVAGLAVVYDNNDFYEPGLLSRDSRGTLHMVQYYPRVDSITPAAGSEEGGTMVRIEGGGFPMDDTYASVKVDGRKCVVTYASIELIVCNTTKQANATVPSKVTGVDHAATGVADVPLSEAQLVGNWTDVADGGASGGAYLAWAQDSTTGSGAPGSAWVTYSPPSAASYAVSVAGFYDVALTVPASAASAAPCTGGLSVNASVVVRSGSGYTLAVVDLAEAALAPQGEVVVGTFPFLAGATASVTVDTTGTGAGTCVAVDSLVLKFSGAIAGGCIDPLAENYDSTAAEDDGSCIFLGGRGLTAYSWSAMHTQYKLDNWYVTSSLFISFFSFLLYTILSSLSLSF